MAMHGVGILIQSYITFFDMISENDLFGACLCSCYENSYLLLILIGAQFSFGAYEIITVFKTLNDSLEDIKISKKQHFIVDRNIMKPIATSLQELTHCYHEICTIIRKFEKANNITLIFLICVASTRFIIKPVLIVAILAKGETISLHLLLPIFWMFMHFLGILMVLEPCHHTQAQAQRTGVILSMLASRFTDTNISRTLFKFSRYVSLNKVRYSPYGICCLSRSLFITILGSAATYLIIIIQFLNDD